MLTFRDIYSFDTGHTQARTYYSLSTLAKRAQFVFPIVLRHVVKLMDDWKIIICIQY